MDHIEVNIKCLPDFSEILLAELSEIGFDSFLDTEEGFKGYAEEKKFREDALKELMRRYAVAAEVQYEVTKIERRNWNEEWEKSYAPIIIDNRCVVKASFHNIEQSFPVEIIINPKMSFGTGHHETTYLMLSQQLELDHNQKDVLDVGCGTGILSIMASKLGASSINGCDIDEWSVENSKENIALNACDNIHIALGSVGTVKFVKQYDIIIANINHNVLLQEIPVYAGLLKEDGHVLVSGFYKNDVPDIQQIGKKNKLLKVNEKLKNNWASVLFHMS